MPGVRLTWGPRCSRGSSRVCRTSANGKVAVRFTFVPGDLGVFFQQVALGWEEAHHPWWLRRPDCEERPDRRPGAQQTERGQVLTRWVAPVLRTCPCPCPGDSQGVGERMDTDRARASCPGEARVQAELTVSTDQLWVPPSLHSPSPAWQQQPAAEVTEGDAQLCPRDRTLSGLSVYVAGFPTGHTSASMAPSKVSQALGWCPQERLLPDTPDSSHHCS